MLVGGRYLAASPIAGVLMPRLAAPPLFDISLAQWSLHKALFAKQLDNLDFPKRAKAFGCNGVEYVNVFWKDKARDEKYVAELKKRCADEGVKCLDLLPTFSTFKDPRVLWVNSVDAHPNPMAARRAAYAIIQAFGSDWHH